MIAMAGKGGPPHSDLTRKNLTRIRRKLRRNKAWFGRLSTVERGIMDLTIGCVERVRSRELTRLLSRILAKVSDVLTSRFLETVRRVGVPLARRISDLVMSWGNWEAFKWAEDPGFIRHLTISRLCEEVSWNQSYYT